MDHFRPFQRSTRLPALVAPTAVHAIREVHDTPLRRPPRPLGTGVRRRIHPEPVNRAATGPLLVALRLPLPTAIHVVRDTHETLESSLRPIPGGSPTCSVDHLDPFQRSTSAT